jgi:hypothetical protein
MLCSRKRRLAHPWGYVSVWDLGKGLELEFTRGTRREKV